jgi:hypothetical protein
MSSVGVWGTNGLLLREAPDTIEAVVARNIPRQVVTKVSSRLIVPPLHKIQPESSDCILTKSGAKAQEFGGIALNFDRSIGADGEGFD